MRSLLVTRPVATKRHDFVTNPVTTAAWVEVIAAMLQPCSSIEIFSGTGAILQISTGAAGDEAANIIPYQTLPGGSSIMLPVNIAKNKRISVKAVNETADAGDMVLNFFG